MEVTKHNAPLILDEFKKLVAQCEFYAVDQEMTGISSANEKENFGMDPSEAFFPKRSAATRYTAFQIGVALFTPVNDDRTTYEVRPFNFYLRSGDGDSDVVLNMSAVNFLLENNMDFQKWLTCGMGYVTEERETAERAKLFPADTSQTLSETEKAWVTRMTTKILQWYRTGTCDEKNVESDNIQDTPAPASPPTLPETLELKEAHIHSNVDIALHHALKAEEGLRIEVVPSFDSGLPSFLRKKTIIRRVATEEQMSKSNAAEVKRREALLANRCGFREFWKCLVGSKKPHVGHNYSSDLLFMMNQHHASIPMNYLEFKKQVHELFPTLFDTKTLSAMWPVSAGTTTGFKPFATTALGPLLKDIQQRWGKDFIIEFPLGFESYHPRCASAMNGVAHQGAYDAYMTGVVFLHLRKRLSDESFAGSKNLISIFGNHYSMNFEPSKEDDIMLDRSVFHIAAVAPNDTRTLKQILATEAQAQAMAAAAAVVVSASSPTQKAPFIDFDFQLSNLERAKGTETIVAFFLPSAVRTVLDVEERLKAGLIRIHGNEANLAQFFVVRTLKEWKNAWRTVGEALPSSTSSQKRERDE